MLRIVLEDPSDYLDYREGASGTVEIFDIVVNSERRQGKGRRLVTKLIEITNCHMIYVFTRNNNYIAQDFYRGLGFDVAAFLESFYQTDDVLKHSPNALMFTKRIERDK